MATLVCITLEYREEAWSKCGNANEINQSMFVGNALWRRWWLHRLRIHVGVWRMKEGTSIIHLGRKMCIRTQRVTSSMNNISMAQRNCPSWTALSICAGGLEGYRTWYKLIYNTGVTILLLILFDSARYYPSYHRVHSADRNDHFVIQRSSQHKKKDHARQHLEIDAVRLLVLLITNDSKQQAHNLCNLKTNVNSNMLSW